MCDYGIANQSKARVGVLIADQVVFKPSTHTFFFFLRYSKVSTKENFTQNNKSSQCVCASTLSFSIYERILIQDRQTDCYCASSFSQVTNSLSICFKFSNLFQILKSHKYSTSKSAWLPCLCIGLHRLMYSISQTERH